VSREQLEAPGWPDLSPTEGPLEIVGEIFNGGDRYVFSSQPAITNRWISLVPS
jgi:hypothetical protein